MNIEFEAKFYIDHEAFLKKLKKHDAVRIKQNTLMQRWIFQHPLEQDSWIRVRDEGDKVTLSCKSFDGTQNIDSVKELEVVVNDFGTTCQLLESLGLKKIRYVQNYREIWQLDDCYLMIDQWPGLEPFVEIEGQCKYSVVVMVEQLGLFMGDAHYGPTSILYEKRYNLSRKDFGQIDKLTFESVSKQFQKNK